MSSLSYDLPNNSHFSVENIYEALSTFRGNVSIGPDGIVGDFLYYDIRDVISFSLWMLFIKSHDEGIFHLSFNLQLSLLFIHLV